MLSLVRSQLTNWSSGAARSAGLAVTRPPLSADETATLGATRLSRRTHPSHLAACRSGYGTEKTSSALHALLARAADTHVAALRSLCGADELARACKALLRRATRARAAASRPFCYARERTATGQARVTSPTASARGETLSAPSTDSGRLDVGLTGLAATAKSADHETQAQRNPHPSDPTTQSSVRERHS